MYGKDGSSMTEPVAVPAQSSCRFGKGTKQELLICIKDYPNVSREHEKRVFAIIGENLNRYFQSTATSPRMGDSF